MERNAERELFFLIVGLVHGTKKPKIPESTAKTMTVAMMIGISVVTHIARMPASSLSD